MEFRWMMTRPVRIYWTFLMHCISTVAAEVL